MNRRGAHQIRCEEYHPKSFSHSLMGLTPPSNPSDKNPKTCNLNPGIFLHLSTSRFPDKCHREQTFCVIDESLSTKSEKRKQTSRAHSNPKENAKRKRTLIKKSWNSFFSERERKEKLSEKSIADAGLSTHKSTKKRETKERKKR